MAKLPAVAMSLAMASVGLGAEPGRITGLLRCAGPGGEIVVWAVASDCRRSYRTVEFCQNRFSFEAVPPGTYRLVGYCDNLYSQPTEEFRVESAKTVDMDVAVRNPAIDGRGSPVPHGIAPFSGRIVDEAGQPVANARVYGEFHPYASVWAGPETVSDPDGRFGYCAVRVSFGKLTLTVTHPDYRARRLRLSLTPFNYSDGHLEVKLRKKSGGGKPPKTGAGGSLR